MFKYIGLNIFLFLLFIQCNNKKETFTAVKEVNTERQDSIINEYHTNCALKYSYRIQMKEWQNCLDKGLAADSTIAYLWQKKAMPYFKAKKYEVGMEFLDKAVKYKPERWLSYRAFIKCIFSKQYKAAIIDFKKAYELNGYDYEMDHSYDFYIALCHLQLNDFEKAESIFREDIKKQVDKWGEAHYIDQFYYGITKYELGKWQEAIDEFDKTLAVYGNFSDVKFYKALCLRRLDKFSEYRELIIEAKKDAALHNTFNEDNSIYEPYPYKVRW